MLTDEEISVRRESENTAVNLIALSSMPKKLWTTPNRIYMAQRIGQMTCMIADVLTESTMLSSPYYVLQVKKPITKYNNSTQPRASSGAVHYKERTDKI